MAGLAWPAAMGAWTIDAVTMTGPGWRPVNLEALWSPAPNRGSNRVVPGVDGSTAYPRHIAERSVDVFLLISGDVDQSGTPHTDPAEGLVANLDTIATIVAPPTPPTVTRLSTVTMPDAGTRTAQVQVEQLSDPVRQGGNVARAVLTLTIPAGAHE